MMPELKWSDDAVLGFVMASKGYPGSYQKGFEITGLDDALSDPAIRIYHMGTKTVATCSGSSDSSLCSAPPIASDGPLPLTSRGWLRSSPSGQVATAGGRVLMVVASGADLKEARDKALEAVRRIKCENLFYRTDIGHWVL